MANSTFWRGLAKQFRALPVECSMLRADRHYQVGSGKVGEWTLLGPASAKVRFEALARRAASEIPNSPSPDLLTAWFELLMKQSDSGFRFDPIATEENPDGGPGQQHLTGHMYTLPKVSANYCQTLESVALQAEFEEKQRKDPRNWSPLRRQYEALKSVKELGNEPPERIPEDFVRNTLAQQYGIKPEDVTLAQIKLEVSGLLSTYPRIELIPSTPKKESPSAPEQNVEPVAASTPLETIASQLQRHRKECNWSAERLAEAVKFDLRTVTRHLSGETTPHLRNISVYERVFSKQLKKQVVINKMP